MNELALSGKSWPLIPMALAQLEEQELEQNGLNDEEKQAKKRRIVEFYRHAIQLGYNSPDVLRRDVQLSHRNRSGA